MSFLCARHPTSFSRSSVTFWLGRGLITKLHFWGQAVRRRSSDGQAPFPSLQSESPRPWRASWYRTALQLSHPGLCFYPRLLLQHRQPLPLCPSTPKVQLCLQQHDGQGNHSQSLPYGRYKQQKKSEKWASFRKGLLFGHLCPIPWKPPLLTSRDWIDGWMHGMGTDVGGVAAICWDTYFSAFQDQPSGPGLFGMWTS